jgi:hypothetical protein
VASQGLKQDASEFLDEPILAGIWLQTNKPPWYEDVATPFEFIIPLLLLPVIVYSFFRRDGGWVKCY